MSGTLFEGIDCWEERKPMLTKDDVKTRVNKVIRMEASNGIQYIRTHVDINDPSLVALKAILELREEVKDLPYLFIGCFPLFYRISCSDISVNGF